MENKCTIQTFVDAYFILDEIFNQWKCNKITNKEWNEWIKEFHQACLTIEKHQPKNKCFFSAIYNISSLMTKVINAEFLLIKKYSIELIEAKKQFQEILKKEMFSNAKQDSTDR